MRPGRQGFEKRKQRVVLGTPIGQVGFDTKGVGTEQITLALGLARGFIGKDAQYSNLVQRVDFRSSPAHSIATLKLIASA